MNIVYIHRQGDGALDLLASVVAEREDHLFVHPPHTALDSIAQRAPAMIVLDVTTYDTEDTCRSIKGDRRTSGVPLLLIGPPGTTSSRRWALYADDMLELPLDREDLSRRLHAWCSLQKLWERRLVTQVSSTLHVLRRVASLARRARGVDDERLADDARSFGAFLELSETDLAALEDGARLHDFTDLMLPARGLGESVERYMPELCESLLAPIVPPSVLAIIRHHSERWDGTGYPDQLHGETIPRLARILRLLLTFDDARREQPWDLALDIVDADARTGGADPALHAEFVAWLQETARSTGS